MNLLVAENSPPPPPKKNKKGNMGIVIGFGTLVKNSVLQGQHGGGYFFFFWGGFCLEKASNPKEVDPESAPLPHSLCAEGLSLKVQSLQPRTLNPLPS